MGFLIFEHLNSSNDFKLLGLHFQTIASIELYYWCLRQGMCFMIMHLFVHKRMAFLKLPYLHCSVISFWSTSNIYNTHSFWSICINMVMLHYGLRYCSSSSININCILKVIYIQSYNFHCGLCILSHQCHYTRNKHYGITSRVYGSSLFYP